ncbi:hypothetical protein [Marinomonas sp.]
MANTRAQTAKTKEQASQTFTDAEKVAAETVDNLKEKAQQTFEASSESLHKATEQAEKVVKKRPLLSIGCAFAAGWAVSKLLK